MFLKRLELTGFKSFVQHIRIEFDPGINVIVGPNGSGKSNIVDALRWVLGEQNARSLRGSRMDDLIFAGTAEKKPVSFAEVSLVMNNHDRILPLDFDEIEVRRRLDRNGNSDYFLNRVQCRLRDVLELFHDTGIGKDLYSFIGQGKVDELLDSRAEDRRRIFEEAAGIMRLKARRNEAVRHLEATSNQLLRIEDRIGHLAERLPDLAVRADRAERYLQLRERWSALTWQVDVQRAHQLLLSSKALDRKRKEENDELSRARRHAEELNEHLEENRQQLLQLDEQYEQVQHELLFTTRQAEQKKSALLLAEQKYDHLVQTEKATQQELDDLERQIAYSRQQHDQELESRRELEAKLNDLRDKLDARKRDVEQERERQRQLRAAEQESRRSLSACIVELEKMSSERSHGQTSQAMVQDDVAYYEEEIKRLDDLLAAKYRQMHAAGEAAVQLEAKRLESELAEQQLQRELDEYKRNHEELSRNLQQCLQQRERLNSRRHVLQEMENMYEGYFGGVREVLRGRERGVPAYAGVCGVIAEIIRVDARLETAIEVALGAAMQNLVTRTQRDAQLAIEELKRSRSGRATFLPLDVIRPNEPAASDRDFDRQSGVLGWAVNLVRFDSLYRPAISFLLGRILVTENLSKAREIALHSKFRYRIVTLDGEVIHPGGSMTGGVQKNRPTALLSRSREIEELTRAVAELDEQANRLRRQLNELQSVIKQCAARLEDTAKKKRDWEEKRNDARKEQTLLQQSLTDLDNRRTEYNQRLEQYREQMRVHEEKLAAQSERWHEVERRKVELEGVLEKQIEAIKQSEEYLALLEREYRAWEIEFVRNEQMFAALVEAFHRDEQSRRRADEQLRTLQRKLETLAEDRRNTEQEKVAATEQLRAAESRSNELQAISIHLQQQRAEYSLQQQKWLRELEQQRRAMEKHRSKLQVYAAENGKLRSEWIALAERARSRGQNIKDLIKETSYDDAEQLQAELARIERALNEIGAVDPTVIEEYEQVSQQHDYLSRQYEDLSSAKRDLEQLIADLDDRMQRIFRTVFRQVGQSFQQVFKKLFQGGHAELVLLPGEEGAPDGIDILVQPPGKRLQNLSMLSGGERALTAIALLFALLSVRPAPFCVLDEIDAALDETNLVRFNRYLKEMAEETQFIIISHKKITMESADRLFGVTSQEKGISRLVAVRLSDWQEDESETATA